MTITGYSDNPLYNFYHPIHLHGHEMYVLAQGFGKGMFWNNHIDQSEFSIFNIIKVDYDSLTMYPNGSSPYFECIPEYKFCPYTRQLEAPSLNFDNPVKVIFYPAY